MASRRPKSTLRFAAILVLAGVGTGLAAFGGWRYARASAPVNGPIVLISIDTLRADHLPVYGYRKVKTPAIDALAADGTVFDRAYSHAPLTLPAHVSLLSGRLPFETGVRDDGGTLNAGERMLPQMLRDRGYLTGGVVSAFLLGKQTGLGRGFDFFDSDIPTSADTPVERAERDGAESEGIAERWLDQQHSGRVFLFLHLYEPHRPYAPPAEYAEYDPYDGEIAYADDIVGRLIRFLKSHQLYDRSTIVLLSDHGEGLGDHGESEHGLFLYEEDIHVPLIIKQAGASGAGRRVRQVVQHIDLVPTLLDLAKAPIPGNLRGRSLKPLFEDGTLQDRAVYSEAQYGHAHFDWGGLTAATSERYRYISGPREELYDLSRDAHERENLAATDSTARDTLHRALLEFGPAAPVDAAADPNDKLRVLEMYREAVDLAADHKFSRAIGLLQRIVTTDEDLAEVWERLARFAVRIDRLDLAVNAWDRVTQLRPDDPSASLAKASALIKARRLDDASEEARRAADIAPAGDTRSIAAAHALLARIALARRDSEAAREEAKIAQQSDAAFPMPSYVEGRLQFDEGSFEDALPSFRDALAIVNRADGSQLPELHWYTGETLLKLERFEEAESEFLDELRYFPENVRANAGLATVYYRTDRADEADATVAGMIRTTPTPDSYAIAERLWRSFGRRRQAESVHAEASALFGARAH